MTTPDIIVTAITNTFRSKARMILTILAIFVGAFTLTLTSGLGTGINKYIDDTVSTIGAENAMLVLKTPEEGGLMGPAASGPVEYDPDALSMGPSGGPSIITLSPADIETIKGIDGVLDVHATRTISTDFIQAGDGTRFVAQVGGLVPGQTPLLSAGAQPDADSTELQLGIPSSYVEPLGFASAEDAVGSTVTVAVSDTGRTQHLLEATVVGVTEESVVSPTGPSLLPNDALTEALFEAQTTGLPGDQADRYVFATAWFAEGAPQADVDALQSALADAGFTGTTVAEQLGVIKSIIDGIVLVLNGFALIALLAASFGIVNTLFMSVQERTREIGLMKAMGMGSGRVFSLFSLEAVFFGFLGSALGVVVAMIAGTAISNGLSTTLLADLSGLNLVAFDPLAIASIVLVVMGIAFLAGTLPAARAAKADPVESLRYE